MKTEQDETTQETEDVRQQDGLWVQSEWKRRRPKTYQRMQADGTLSQVAMQAGDDLRQKHQELFQSGMKEPEAYLQAVRETIALPDDQDG